MYKNPALSKKIQDAKTHPNKKTQSEMFDDFLHGFVQNGFAYFRTNTITRNQTAWGHELLS